MKNSAFSKGARIDRATNQNLSHRRPPRRAIIATLLLIGATSLGFAFQSSSWLHIESEHFVVSYDRQRVRFAQQAVKTAEETREALVSYFGDFAPSTKIAIVLSDSSDNVNGGASERDYIVYIDCRKTALLFRGESDWLRTVLTHELSHIYSIQLLRSAFFVRLAGGLSTDNASIGLDALLGNVRLPSWFVEGLAQMGSNGVGADRRDPIREMVLRDAALGGRLLDLAHMARFEGGGLDAELAYNQGFSFLLFLEKSYPELPIKGLCSLVRERGIEKAFAQRYGKPLGLLYEDWKTDLIAKLPGESSWDSGSPLFEREGRLVLETSSAAGASYVAANWGNDYERFSVFSKNRDGTYKPLASDTGPRVVSDRVTGDIWFSKLVYDFSSGVQTYDLFTVAASGGKPKRATTGARCLVFDAQGGRLVYAKYRDEITSVIAREPDGSESTLADFPYRTSVDSISVLGSDSVLIVLGTGGASRAIIVSSGGIEELWESEDVIDAVDAGQGRIVFCSAVSGSPQLYWADLTKDPQAWYQITDVPAGARYPLVEGGDNPALYYSRFEDGGYRLYRLDDPFGDEHPRIIESEARVDYSPPDGSATGRSPFIVKETLANPVFDLGPITIGFAGDSTNRDDSRGSAMFGWSTILGIGASLYDAPGDIGLDAALKLQIPVLRDYPLNPALDARLRGILALGSTRSEFGFSLRTASVYYALYNLEQKYKDYQAYGAMAFQLGRNQRIETQISYDSFNTEMDSGPVEYFQDTAVKLQWIISELARSVFDPAALGGDGYLVYLAANGISPTFPDRRFFPGEQYILDARYIGMLSGGASFHVLLGNGALGIGGELGGYATFGAANGSSHVPFVTSSLGGFGSNFAGYPRYYASANDLASASFEIGANPFANNRTSTTWIQRMSLSLKVDAGIARCIERGLEIDYPVSVSATLRHRVYLSNDSQPIAAQFSFAWALNDFMSSMGDKPFQFYAGISY